MGEPAAPEAGLERRLCSRHSAVCHARAEGLAPGPQVHLRHLVGGRARSYMGELPHERIFQARPPDARSRALHALPGLCCHSGIRPLAARQADLYRMTAGLHAAAHAMRSLQAAAATESQKQDGAPHWVLRCSRAPCARLPGGVPGARGGAGALPGGRVARVERDALPLPPHRRVPLAAGPSECFCALRRAGGASRRGAAGSAGGLGAVAGLAHARGGVREPRACRSRSAVHMRLRGHAG